jgi:UDP-2,3-diacylglucosamine hydrolase
MNTPFSNPITISGIVYFASDFHLGAPNAEASKEREQRIITWLEQIEKDATHLFLLGDIFDFWFE